MKTNNPNFSEDEIFKQTKRIIDSMQDEEANKEFQSIMKESNFSKEDFTKCLLKLDDNQNDAELQRIYKLYEDLKKLPNNKISKITNNENETIKIIESSFEDGLFYGASFISYEKE